MLEKLNSVKDHNKIEIENREYANKLKLAVESSKDILDKQWSSIDSLSYKASLLIAMTGILFGFVFQTFINKSQSLIYFLSVLFLFFSILFSIFTILPIDVPAGTKIGDLKRFATNPKENEISFLEHLLINNESFLEKGKKKLTTRWIFFKISLVFLVISIISIIYLAISP